MSRSLNRATLIGNLGAEPELRTTAGGTQVCRLAIATSETWKDKTDGSQREETEWHRVVLWGRLAEIAAQYLHKGDKVFLEGRIKTRKWTGQDGSERYTTEIVADELLMLGARTSGPGQASYPAGPAHGYPGSQAMPSQRPAPAQASAMPQADVDWQDDIPF